MCAAVRVCREGVQGGLKAAEAGRPTMRAPALSGRGGGEMMRRPGHSSAIWRPLAWWPHTQASPSPRCGHERAAANRFGTPSFESSGG
eukprot:1834357-Prymnesium_polylepis.1